MSRPLNLLNHRVTVTVSARGLTFADIVDTLGRVDTSKHFSTTRVATPEAS